MMHQFRLLFQDVYFSLHCVVSNRESFECYIGEADVALWLGKPHKRWSRSRPLGDIVVNCPELATTRYLRLGDLLDVLEPMKSNPRAVQLFKLLEYGCVRESFRQHDTIYMTECRPYEGRLFACWLQDFKLEL